MIEIRNEGYISGLAMKRARRISENLPEDILDKFSDLEWKLIVISNEIGFTKSQYFQTEEEQNGYFDPEPQAIGVIESQLLYRDLRKADDTLHHEFGHFIYFYILDFPLRYTNLMCYSKAKNKLDSGEDMYDSFLRKYSSKDQIEFFADCVSAYFNDLDCISDLILNIPTKKRLKKLHPEMMPILDSLFQ